MRLLVPLVLPAVGFALATLEERGTATKCNNDNCARAVTGTVPYGPTHPAVARSDCRRLLQSAITPPVVTILATETVVAAATTLVDVVKRSASPLSSGALPAYASSCSNPAAYSSACSCFGVTPTTITASIPVTIITVTQDVTGTVISTSTTAIASSTSSSTPPCSTDLLTDATNCGSCGNVCSSGVCEEGSCSSSQCTAGGCGNFTGNCNNQGLCFCFTSTDPAPSNGFCGQNAGCDQPPLTPCANDTDCTVAGSTGNICAVNTCCPQPSPEQPGVCLQGQCGNPGSKLKLMAKMVKDRRQGGRTAAF